MAARCVVLGEIGSRGPWSGTSRVALLAALAALAVPLLSAAAGAQEASPVGTPAQAQTVQAQTVQVPAGQAPAGEAPAVQTAATPLDPLTVSATRTPEPTDSVPFSVDQRHAEDVDLRRARRLDDLLRDMPGVESGGGPRRAAQSPNIRGLEGNRVLLMLDGARQNFDAGHKGRVFLDPEILKQVDVLKGGASALRGSGAMGGVIEMTTKDAADFLEPGQTAGLRLKAGYSSAAREPLYSGTAFARPAKGVDMLASVTGRDARDLRLGNGDRLDNSAEDLLSGLFKIGVEPAKHHRVTLSHIFFNQDGDIPSNGEGAAGPENPLVHRRTNQRQWVLNYAGSDPATPLFNPNVTLYSVSLDTRERRIDGVSRLDKSKQSTVGFDVYNTSRFTLGGLRNALTYGVEYYREKQRGTRNGVLRPQFPKSSGDVLGIYLQDAVQLTDTLSVIGTVRYDSFWRDPDDPSLRDTQEDAISPRLGVMWQALPWLGLYANGGYAFRAPALTELFVAGQHFPTNDFIPNPELKAEKSVGYESGVRLKFSDLLEPGDRLRLGGAFYDTYYKDFIAQVFDFTTFPSTTTNVNLSKARIWGVEIEGMYDARYWFASLGASRIRGKDRNTGDPIDTIPADKVVGTVGGKLPALDLIFGWRAEAAAKQRRVTQDALKTKGYVIHGVFASWQPSQGVLDGLRVDVGIDNIFDRNYRRHLDTVREAGIDVGGTVSYTIRF